ARRVHRRRPAARPNRRGRLRLGAAPGDPPPASAARAARPGLSGRPDPRDLRRRRPPRGGRAALRAHQRVRRRVPHGRPDRAGPAGPADGLTEEQTRGVLGAFAHRLSLITGGPGTGKTASIRTIAKLASGQGARVLLVAPTGRAAIRMHEASGMRATTVHSALGWVPGEGPTHDAHDPLECDLLIVDETSMANLELLVTLLRAVGPKAHVVLVGDAD